MMKIAILGSNKLRINQNVAAGPEIFTYSFVKNFITNSSDFDLTVFASGDSDIKTKLISINQLASSEDEDIGEKWHKLYEFQLLSKAFSMQDQFDLYHTNIGNGEVILPFANFVHKPILITLHSSLADSKAKKYMELFKPYSHIHFVAISNQQKSLMPDLNYINTIYHGIDLSEFEYSSVQSEEIFWIGRGVPEKGLDIAFDAIRMCKKPAYFYISPRESQEIWLNNLLTKNHNLAKIQYNAQRGDTVNQYKKSKLLLFPIKWEEPFGLVMLEAMAVGTPVVAFARGSVPEVIKDGVTGFLVNPSNDDIRGQWIIKKTGIDGIVEAINKIYGLSEDEYQQMRQQCRKHIESNFSINRMITDYQNIYRQLINNQH